MQGTVGRRVEQVSYSVPLPEQPCPVQLSGPLHPSPLSTHFNAELLKTNEWIIIYAKATTNVCGV